MKPLALCSATMAVLTIVLPMPAEAMGTNFWIRLKTDLQGLDVSIQTVTVAGVVATAQLENRTDRTVYCSVGFFNGFDLRKRTAHALTPEEKRPYVYRVHQEVGSVPMVVSCAESRNALPPNYL
ncbi:hypothetical protein [Aromatoleum toluclasticum]|uniref:hypothetical protein n=1 Tax=Aromatoleum toluclasticum TaxID=92003 RepID=UPI0012F84A11|nr:hypothetical protein [Aromatoleum toluclasticum]